MHTSPEVIHLADSSRFEIQSDDVPAKLEYRIHEKNMTIVHTFVPLAYRGQGYAAILAEAAIGFANKSHLEILSECSYIDRYLPGRR